MNDNNVLRTAVDLGRVLRTARQQQKLAQATAANLAGISRQHYSEIETGKAANVELPTLLNILGAVGLALEVRPTDNMVKISQYEQLRDLSWNRDSEGLISEQDALALYERNWRFVDQGHIQPREKKFISRLVHKYGNGVMLV